MKHVFQWLLISIALAGFCPVATAELLVFAGAGMRAPLSELGRNFTQDNGTEVVYDFAGSGRLGGKVLMGVSPDLFIPGSDKWAEKLKDEGFIRKCVPLAYHTPVIITPKGTHKVGKINDLTRKDIRIALGDPEAAAIGRNNRKLFKRANLDPAAMNIVARGVTVKQLVQWVESGSVDAAIVWRADALQSGRVETVELPADINQIERIPMCLMNTPAHPQEAAKFWSYLLEQAPIVFARHGFHSIQP